MSGVWWLQVQGSREARGLQGGSREDKQGPVTIATTKRFLFLLLLPLPLPLPLLLLLLLLLPLLLLLQVWGSRAAG